MRKPNFSSTKKTDSSGFLTKRKQKVFSVFEKIDETFHFFADFLVSNKLYRIIFILPTLRDTTRKLRLFISIVCSVFVEQCPLLVEL